MAHILFQCIFTCISICSFLRWKNIYRLSTSYFGNILVSNISQYVLIDRQLCQDLHMWVHDFSFDIPKKLKCLSNNRILTMLSRGSHKTLKSNHSHSDKLITFKLDSKSLGKPLPKHLTFLIKPNYKHLQINKAFDKLTIA